MYCLPHSLNLAVQLFFIILVYACLVCVTRPSEKVKSISKYILISYSTIWKASVFIKLASRTLQTIQKLERSMTLTYLRQLPDWRECPRAECSAGQLCANGNEKPCITCNTCTQKFCYKHKMPWHEGKTCEQHDARFDESAELWV